MLVTCLCATWCTTCELYRQTFAEMAKLFPETKFRWIDIEDESDFVGDVDVVNFPTLLITEGRQIRFFGTVTTQLRVLEAMIAASAKTTASQRELGRGIEDLADRLAALNTPSCL